MTDKREKAGSGEGGEKRKIPSSPPLFRQKKKEIEAGRNKSRKSRNKSKKIEAIENKGKEKLKVRRNKGKRT